MNDQLRLDLNDENPDAWRRPKFPERVFLAILLDAASALRAEATARQIRKANALQGKLLLRERLHITLQHIGDYTRLKSKIRFAANLVGAAVSMSPFDVTFDRAESFPAPPRRDRPREYPAVLRGGSDPLFELHRLLAGAMRKFGFRASDAFVPHITMIYADKAIAPQAIEPVCWTVRDFALIHSERGLTRYNILERWPLHG
jgi:RNA 2',3'-cyclic 3'-phosphodiesterase